MSNVFPVMLFQFVLTGKICFYQPSGSEVVVRRSKSATFAHFIFATL